GFSLPAAIGAALAPGKAKGRGATAVSIAGDGGFVHTMGELVVARELDVPLVAVVFVDGALGILKHQAEEMYGEHHFVNLAPIDFAAVAKSFGVESRTVTRAAELDDAVAWAIQAGEPVLLAVVLDPDEVFPPLRTKIEQRKKDLLGQK
ncbi:MAG: thiamine pyrophosphate-binding protein, partial [Gammaproteobacteria bacterium]|nr:thiamine pyrophosphate-binding protein [Gammaproteobacteria bacterium]